MKVGKYFKPITTLAVGMASLAVIEMFAPKVASVIVSTGSKVKRMFGGK